MAKNSKSKGKKSKGATKPGGFGNFSKEDIDFWSELDKELAEMKQTKRQSQGIRQKINPFKLCWLRYKRRKEHKLLLRQYKKLQESVAGENDEAEDEHAEDIPVTEPQSTNQNFAETLQKTDDHKVITEISKPEKEMVK